MYIGIDPGLQGAIALYNPANNSLLIHDMPYFLMTIGKTRKKRLDGVTIQHMLKGFKDVGAQMACIEAQNPRPRQSAQSVYATGWGAGLLYQACVSLLIPMEHVPPSVWKRIIKAPKEKPAAVARANELFPESAHLFRGPRGGIMDGRAEAAMIAYFCAHKLGVPSTEVDKTVLKRTSL